MSYISFSWASTSWSFLSGEKEDEIQHLSLLSDLASREESARNDQANQDLLPSTWPNSEPYSHEYIMGIQSYVLASSQLVCKGYIQGC